MPQRREAGSDPATSDRTVLLQRGETVYLVLERLKQIMVLLFHGSIDRSRLHGGSRVSSSLLVGARNSCRRGR